MTEPTFTEGQRVYHDVPGCYCYGRWLNYEDVALLVDAMRCTNGLPWQPLDGARG